MRTLLRFFKRLSSWANGRKDEERLRAEIEAHLALQTDENIHAGLSAEEARRQAVLKFGPVEAVKERYRERKGLPSMEALILDTRYALRRLRMGPAFAIATMLTLALGIGATTSIFTLVHAVLLKSLPVTNPSELRPGGGYSLRTPLAPRIPRYCRKNIYTNRRRREHAPWLDRTRSNSSNAILCPTGLRGRAAGVLRRLQEPNVAVHARQEPAFFTIFSTMIGAVEIARMLPERSTREKVLSHTRDFLLRSF